MAFRVATAAVTSVDSLAAAVSSRVVAAARFSAAVVMAFFPSASSAWIKCHARRPIRMNMGDLQEWRALMDLAGFSRTA
jgi:hypothetical protein